MLAMSTNDLALNEIWLSSDPENARLRVDFPINNSVGSREHGGRLLRDRARRLPPDPHRQRRGDPLHRPGHRSRTVGDEEGIVRAGDLAVIPALVPHGVANVGEDTVKVVGFFSDSYISSVFEDTLEPIGSANPEMGTARERV